MKKNQKNNLTAISALLAFVLLAGCGLFAKKPAHMIKLGDKTDLKAGEALKR